MERYQVILAYDGTDFLGYQRQAKGRTVQDEVEKSLRRIGWQGKHILAAGRTDTGVHACGQVIAFDIGWNHSPQDLRQALNATLPLDIVARVVQPVNPKFDPRRHALSRCYEFRLFAQDVRDPLRERYAWRVWPPAEWEKLQQAATVMIGRFDFRAFGTPPRIGGSTVRKVMRSLWRIRDTDWVYTVEANAFLYHMVRRLVAAQVAVGQGKASLADLQKALHPVADESLQGLAPAQGTYLMEVNYLPENLMLES